MNNRDAIDIIRNNWPPTHRGLLSEALEKAIDALESAKEKDSSPNKQVTTCRHEWYPRAFTGEIYCIHCGAIKW